MHYFNADFFNMFFIPKHLKLFAGGMPSGAFVHNLNEGYRTLVPIKTNKINPSKKPKRQGGVSVFIGLYAWLPAGSRKCPLSSG